MTATMIEMKQAERENAAMSRSLKITSDHLKTIAHEIFMTMFPDGENPVRNVESAVYEIMQRPEKTEAQTYALVDRIGDEVFFAYRSNDSAKDIEALIFLNLLWAGYWLPNA